MFIKLVSTGMRTLFLARLSGSIVLTLLCLSIVAQRSTLGASRGRTLEELRSYSRSFEENRDSCPKHSFARLRESADTLIYRVSNKEELKCQYVFSNDLCVELRVQFSCYVCLNKGHRKWIFKGRWRVDETGTMYRRKKPASASIRRLEDCPFLYEVHLSSMDEPVSKKTFRKMRVVEKRLIGRWDRLLTE